jgi:hypothetical protein
MFEDKDKPMTDVNNEEQYISSNDVYIFSRVLGHLEITKGHKWVER